MPPIRIKTEKDSPDASPFQKLGQRLLGRRSIQVVPKEYVPPFLLVPVHPLCLLFPSEGFLTKLSCSYDPYVPLPSSSPPPDPTIIKTETSQNIPIKTNHAAAAASSTKDVSTVGSAHSTKHLPSFHPDTAHKKQLEIAGIKKEETYEATHPLNYTTGERSPVERSPFSVLYKHARPLVSAPSASASLSSCSVFGDPGVSLKCKDTYYDIACVALYRHNGKSGASRKYPTTKG